MRNYNHFTIDYITTIITTLDIEISNNGKAIVFPERISEFKLTALKENIGSLWKDSQTAIDICKNKHDAKIQSGLFGLVDDFNKAMQIGFLISDRVVLIDYLFDRLLRNSDFKKINIPHVCAVASELASLLPLAERGRVVIIPSPFSWNDESKQLIHACVEDNNKIFTPYMMAMVNMFSIIRLCKLHPYTIAESDANYDEITSVNISTGSIISKLILEHAHKRLLGSLFTEKSLMREGFVTSDNITISKFQEIIQGNKKFQSEYLSRILSGGEIDLSVISNELEVSILDEINNSNKNSLKKLIPAGVLLSSGSGYSLSYFYSTSPTLTAFGALIGFSSTALGLLLGKSESDDPIVQVFAELKKNGL
ncbi:hypothetical protein [Yersinia intermedia]|uniref:hypothetical protein n=1 Tax=Yersinia intermedia TaxID=631 RepID=UPI001CFE5613|nr:hypothetical protein [Yersinia intermedia]MCB5313306.1 hypothetical protein [Yersinia intermedia]